jgi:hypothetical protein
MGNGALPNGPSYRAHPRLYLFRTSLDVSLESVMHSKADLTNVAGQLRFMSTRPSRKLSDMSFELSKIRFHKLNRIYDSTNIFVDN